MIDAAPLILRWYLALAILGIAGLLPAAVLCDRLHTRGVLYARPLAIAVVAVVVWFLAWLRVPYGTPLIVAVLLALTAWSISIAWLRPALVRAILERRAVLIAGEVVCLLVFAIVITARMYAPDANGTEKPMDLMILTAVHEADRMPPADPWLAGFSLSYYHLGHLSADILGRLSGNGPGTMFNLATATAGALAAAAITGLAIDVIALGRVAPRGAMIVGGTVAVATLLLVTPLVGLVNLAAANGLGDPATWAALGVKEVPVPVGEIAGVPTTFWWWWTNTRILPGTISEFPAFTLLLGDPHAHLLSLPISLTAVALALTVFEGASPLTWRRWLMQPERLALTGVAFAAIFMTNAWDIVVYGGLWGVAAILAYLRTGWSLMPALMGVVRWAMVPAAVAGVLAFGFIETLDTPRLGLAPVVGEHSDPVRWLLVWLPPLLPVLAALALLRPRADRGATAIAVSFALAPLAGWFGLVINAGGPSEFAARGTGWVVIAGLVAAVTLAAGAATTADGRFDRAQAAALALLTAVLGILLATELFRVADAFPGRFNTVFKFWFTAWTLLALAAGALAGLAWERGTVPVRAWLSWPVRLGVPLALLAALATALYLPAMAVSRGRDEGQFVGLDAVTYLQRVDPGRYATIEWAREHLHARSDVILEAVSESYTAGNMVSAATGVPTLLGWPNHERQWRRSVPEDERRRAVDAIYAGGASSASLEVARRFGVTYVYIGREERAAYGTNVAARFAAWPAVVDEAGALLVQVPMATTR